MGQGDDPIWSPTSVSLLSGERDAVLIDALMTFEEAQRAVDWIRATGKTLTTVYITHAHGDHFFGLNTILAAYPQAKAVTLSEVVPFAQEHVAPDSMRWWSARFPDQIPGHPLVPQPLMGNVIDLEGHELRVINIGQSDTQPSTIVHIPDLDAVVAGDVAYNGIHQYLRDTDHEKREAWIASVDKIATLRPKIVVAGHKRLEAPDDNAPAILSATKTYVRDFDQAMSESQTPQELFAKMMVLHGDRGNPYALWESARGVFQQR